ncbi:MAG TPA: hypothetical protein ENK48_02210 [Gammaproteobacteria bacterium]|nr:hypothetical protein [Gammaproteobacteria bacterium]
MNSWEGKLSNLRITHHASRITHHASRITHHASRITHHASRITHYLAGIPKKPSLATPKKLLRTIQRSSALTSLRRPPWP